MAGSQLMLALDAPQLNIPSLEYRDVTEFPGYRVGSDGTVWTAWKGGRRSDGSRGSEWTIGDTWKQLKPGTTGGYLFVILRRDGKSFNRLVHLLVKVAFCGPCPEGHECAHDNGIKTDCRIGNLIWKTHVENLKDQWRHGTKRHGANCANAKLTAAQVVEIRTRRVAGETLASLGRRFGVSDSTISKIVHRTRRAIA